MALPPLNRNEESCCAAMAAVANDRLIRPLVAWERLMLYALLGPTVEVSNAV